MNELLAFPLVMLWAAVPGLAAAQPWVSSLCIRLIWWHCTAVLDGYQTLFRILPVNFCLSRLPSLFFLPNTIYDEFSLYPTVNWLENIRFPSITSWIKHCLISQTEVPFLNSFTAKVRLGIVSDTCVYSRDQKVLQFE